ncbi:MAG: multidrug transporter [Actinomycetia bacterium]|nr:multidrug transporter [Actinomycetes bacterium]
MTDALTAESDGRRWLTFAIVVTSMFIVGVDNTIFGVLLPSLLHDLRTTLPSVQWVITGYPLVFASLLIVGGRIGDIFGFRRTFVTGAGLFGFGSLLCAFATSVPHLLVGYVFLEGAGAALMLPSALAIISTVFHGRERGMAFTWYGVVAGLGVALGPVVGGFLTSSYSWRWAYGINVIVSPLVAIGALLLMPHDHPNGGRRGLDLRGAALSALAMFSLVFGISQSARYGWWRPVGDVTVLGRVVWPTTRPVSAAPLAFVVAAVAAAWFVHVERRGQREGRDVLFDLTQLRYPRFRYGLLTTAVAVTGQMGMLLVLGVYLQTGRGLSAAESGLWILPYGIGSILGARFVGWLVRRWTTTAALRLGVALLVLGPLLMAAALRRDATFLSILPATVGMGIGAGMTNAQLVNISLWDVADAQMGTASGMVATARQAGVAFGLAVMGATLATVSASRSLAAVGRLPIPASVRAAALREIERSGPSVASSAGAVREAISAGVLSAAQLALVLAAALAALGVLTTLLIPRLDERDGAPEAERPRLPPEAVAVAGAAT